MQDSVVNLEKSDKRNANRQPQWVEKLEENKVEIAKDGYFSPSKLIIAKYIGQFLLQNISNQLILISLKREYTVHLMVV